MHGATLERLCDCVLACRVVSRGHVPLYAIMSVPVVAVVPWMSWRPWVWPWRGAAVAVAPAVFLPPCGGCDTPTNASVCNGFGGVCVVLVCYLTG